VGGQCVSAVGGWTVHARARVGGWPRRPSAGPVGRQSGGSTRAGEQVGYYGHTRARKKGLRVPPGLCCLAPITPMRVANHWAAFVLNPLVSSYSHSRLFVACFAAPRRTENGKIWQRSQIVIYQLHSKVHILVGKQGLVEGLM
jgi:hypothetical protein